MKSNTAFRRRARRSLCNICRQQGFDMKKIEGKRHDWLVEDTKKRHYAISFKISYEKGSGYYVVRFPEGDESHYGPARLSLRSDSDIASFGNVIMAFSKLRAKRRQ